MHNFLTHFDFFHTQDIPAGVEHQAVQVQRADGQVQGGGAQVRADLPLGAGGRGGLPAGPGRGRRVGLGGQGGEREGAAGGGAQRPGLREEEGLRAVGAGRPGARGPRARGAALLAARLAGAARPAPHPARGLRARVHERAAAARRRVPARRRRRRREDALEARQAGRPPPAPAGRGHFLRGGLLPSEVQVRLRPPKQMHREYIFFLFTE